MKGLFKYLDMHGYSGVEQKKAIIKLILLSEEVSNIEFLDDQDRTELSKYLPNDSDRNYLDNESDLHPKTEDCMLQFQRHAEDRSTVVRQVRQQGFFQRDAKNIAKAKAYLTCAWDLLKQNAANLPYHKMLALMSATAMQGEYKDIDTKIFIQDIQGHERAGDRKRDVMAFLNQLESDLDLKAPGVIEKVVYRPMPADNGWTPLQVVGALSLSALGLFAAGAAAKYASEHDYLPEVDLSLDTIKNWRA